MIGLLLALICLKDVPHTHGTDGLMGRRVYLNSANAVGRTAEQKELKLGDRPEDGDEVLHPVVCGKLEAQPRYLSSKHSWSLFRSLLKQTTYYR